jgi:GcrA cell cycle regulator
MAKTWYPEHDQALAKHLAGGMSHAEAAAALNAKFGTSYSRMASIGRANRLGTTSKVLKSQGHDKHKPKQPRASATHRFKCEHQPRLREANAGPLHLAITELTAETCRYPYGDNAPFTYCGCPPAFEGASYCALHQRLTRRQAA